MRSMDNGDAQMAHLGHSFKITSRTLSDGFKVWGFFVPSLGRGQQPNWHSKADAVASAHFHIAQWR